VEIVALLTEYIRIVYERYFKNVVLIHSLVY
jgi:hypothetical protein